MTSAEGAGRSSGRRILIVGTGGQGVLTAARLLCDVFVDRGHHVVSGQLHGMAQRGGSVQSSVIVDGGISPRIGRGRADFVVGFEPVETVRALSFLSEQTVVYLNVAPVIPFVLGQQYVLKEGDGRYPDVEKLLSCVRESTPHVHTLDATEQAKASGSTKALNMVMLGCLLGSELLPVSAEQFWSFGEARLPPALRKVNHAAFYRGVEHSRSFHAGVVAS